jgi:hypothetical protein
VLPEYGGGKDERDFVIAHPGSKLTQLPARDAVGNGWFEALKSVSKRFLLLRVGTQSMIGSLGRRKQGSPVSFEVEIFYAAKSGGAKYRLSFKGGELDFVIPNAHDVPKLGAEKDRSPRNESYTKDWARLKVGRIELTKGEGELVLRGTQDPGNEAMEFRLPNLEEDRMRALANVLVGFYRSRVP